jgi:hypothetical protein
MSTDWIKMRVDLRTHPKVVRMSSALKADKLRVIGGLFAVWSIFDAHSEDGFLDGYTLKALDDDLGWKGFSQAMANVDWLIDSAADGLTTPRFEEHNGQSAKRRAMETERKRLEREAEKAAAEAAKAATSSGQMSASDADAERTREEKRREEEDQETSNLSVATARPSAEPPQLALVGKKGLPDCPHLEVLALWAEVLPSMPQHLPSQWRGTRADHLRARWRETAEEKGWSSEADGLAYLRKLFGFIRQSDFLTGRAPVPQGRRPFTIELEWLVNRANWAKVVEGKYHEETA